MTPLRGAEDENTSVAPSYRLEIDRQPFGDHFERDGCFEKLSLGFHAVIPFTHLPRVLTLP